MLLIVKMPEAPAPTLASNKGEVEPMAILYPEPTDVPAGIVKVVVSPVVVPPSAAPYVVLTVKVLPDAVKIVPALSLK